MRYRRATPKPKLPDNPYRRFFTAPRSFEELAKNAAEREKERKRECSCKTETKE